MPMLFIAADFRFMIAPPPKWVSIQVYATSKAGMLMFTQSCAPLREDIADAVTALVLDDTKAGDHWICALMQILVWVI